MMLERSVSSAKFSGEALKERQTEAGSNGVTANIFPPTLNTRSLPHWICSVAPGRERQISRKRSTFMGKILERRQCWPQWTSRRRCIGSWKPGRREERSREGRQGERLRFLKAEPCLSLDIIGRRNGRRPRPGAGSYSGGCRQTSCKDSRPGRSGWPNFASTCSRLRRQGP